MTRTDRRCLPFEGCRGEGWLYDLEDSGSGREVYCDCPAGVELRQKELAAHLRETIVVTKEDLLRRGYCLAHMQPEPCPKCAAFKAVGL